MDEGHDESFNPDEATSEAEKFRRILGEKEGEFFQKTFDPEDYDLAMRVLDGAQDPESNGFLRRVKEVAEESNHGIYDLINLVEDARKLGLKLEISLGDIRRIGKGFKVAGMADYKEEVQPFSLTMIPSQVLVSSKLSPEGRKILESGFSKLFQQLPNALYEDDSHGLVTGEWWLGMDKGKIAEEIEEIRKNPNFKIISTEV